MIHPHSFKRKHRTIDPFAAADAQLKARIEALEAHPTLLHPPEVAWDHSQRGRVGPPVVELSGACGVLAFYKTAGALSLRHYADPVLSVGASGGTVPVAFLQTGADDALVLSALKGLPAPAFADYTHESPQWQRAGSSSGAAMTKWLDDWLTYLGHGTWSSYRYDERPPGLESWSHRFNVALTYVAVPADDYDRATEHAELNLVSLVRLLFRSNHKQRLVFHELIAPRDVQPGPHQALPWLYEQFDEMRVADWMAHSMRHPGAFRPHVIRHEGLVYLFLDGCLLRRLPTPFGSEFPPPLPTVAFEMMDSFQASDAEYLERIRLANEHSLISWGGYPGVNPLDFEKLTPEMRVMLYATGSLRADDVYPTDLFNYLDRFRETDAIGYDNGDYRASESATSVLRRKLQRGLTDIRRNVGVAGNAG